MRIGGNSKFRKCILVVIIADEGGAAIVVTLYFIVINIGIWCFVAIIKRERMIYINISKTGFEISYLLFMLLSFLNGYGTNVYKCLYYCNHITDKLQNERHYNNCLYKDNNKNDHSCCPKKMNEFVCHRLGSKMYYSYLFIESTEHYY